MRDVAFSGDDTMVATASFDNSVKIWNAAKGYTEMGPAITGEACTGA